MGDFKAVLVDDEENVRYLLADLLESFHLGIEVTGQAGDGEEALKLCRSLKPDLVYRISRCPDWTGFICWRQ